MTKRFPICLLQFFLLLASKLGDKTSQLLNCVIDETIRESDITGDWIAMDLSDKTFFLSPVIVWHPPSLPALNKCLDTGSYIARLIIRSGKKAKIDVEGAHVSVFQGADMSCVDAWSGMMRDVLGPDHLPTGSRSNFYCFIKPTIIASVSLQS